MAAPDRTRITLRLSVPYPTRWGQTVKVVGSGSSLGGGNAALAPALSCRRHGEQLVWAGAVSVARAAAYTYKYVVVGEDGTVEDEEIRERCLELPSGLQPGAVVDVHDEWQVCAWLPFPGLLCHPHLPWAWCRFRRTNSGGGADELGGGGCSVGVLHMYTRRRLHMTQIPSHPESPKPEYPLSRRVHQGTSSKSPSGIC